MDKKKQTHLLQQKCGLYFSQKETCAPGLQRIFLLGKTNWPLSRYFHRSFAFTSVFLVALGLVGCAHGDASQQRQQQDQESELLRERVRHLERRVSDLDAQLDSISQKVAQGEGTSSRSSYDSNEAADSVSSGEQPYSSARSYDDGNKAERMKSAAPRRNARSKARPQIGIGHDVIELQQKAPPPTLERSSIYDSVPAFESAPADNEVTSSPSVSLQMGSAPSSKLPVGADAQELYDWSLNAFREGSWLVSIAGFEDLLEQFPDHNLSDNALYWTALAHVRRGETQLGIQVWRSLPMRFPGSPKLPDSLFGMAQAHLTLGEKDIAQTLFTQLIKQYPRAECVPDARRALASL
ncbi:MAG: tetratricopeptide repeat protein [Deltaproteobacteria bacterium]|nr:tetratricopeptide repeat protein [Deltaproteobacteria bacterium]